MIGPNTRAPFTRSDSSFGKADQGAVVIGSAHHLFSRSTARLRSVSRGSVDGAYRQKVQTFKLRELGVTYRFPTSFVQQYVRARSASLRFTMRNIQTWTNFNGLDPESDQFLSVPQDQRWTVGMTVTF